MMASSVSPSFVRLNIGGVEFCTTIDTLSRREPDSMLAAMFSGRHTLSQVSEKGYVFIDRDGTHFRHILNWLRDGIVATLSDVEYMELIREAEYYQLLGLVKAINAAINEKGKNDMDADFTRRDMIKSLQFKRLSFQGVNFCDIDLSKLDMSNVNFSYACLRNVNFEGACLSYCVFDKADLLYAKLQNADLSCATFRGANLEGADLKKSKFGASFIFGHSFKVKTTSFDEANLEGADFGGSKLENSCFVNANLKGANFEGADLKLVNFSKANLSGASLRNADL